MEGKGKILLVDDEAPLRMLVGATLEGSGYQLLEAANGREGLEIALRERLDLVLLDIAMPYIDGFEVCRRIKADPTMRNTVVVMLTAMTQEADRRWAKEVGADDYFTKPFSPTALLSKIDQVFAGRK